MEAFLCNTLSHRLPVELTIAVHNNVVGAGQCTVLGHSNHIHNPYTFCYHDNTYMSGSLMHNQLRL